MSTKSSTSKSKGKNKTKKKQQPTKKVIIIVLIVLVVSVALTVLSPLLLPKKAAEEVTAFIESIIGTDTQLGKAYRTLVGITEDLIVPEPAEPEQLPVQTEPEFPAVEAQTEATEPVLRIEGLEIPVYIEGHEVVRHTGYTLSWNEEYLVADWVAYELTAEELDTQEVSRSEDFRPDEAVRKSSQLSDYKGSGYSRGHLAPAQDFKWSANAMSDTFYLTNMVPQLQNNYNAGIWLKAENATRDAARITGTVYVVTGPVLTDGPYETIGENKVVVPKQCYKALLVIDEEGNVHAIAMSIPQTAGKKESLSKYLMSIDDLEMLTGLDFFYELDDEIENEVEASYDVDYWPASFR